MKIIKAIRVKQWLKNLPIFMPSITAGVLNVDLFFELIIIFFSFSLIVSSTYIFNDLIDLESDKFHPVKKYRPIASGHLTISHWIFISALCLIIGKLVLYMINTELLIFSTVYLILTISYSLKLKYLKFLDILTISFLFLLRILIGGPSFNIPITNELYVFVFFICLGIVSGKKLSIRNNSAIKDNIAKTFLMSKYSNTDLISIMYVSFLISSLIYLKWILMTKQIFITDQNPLYLISSLIFLVIFKLVFIVESLKNRTEDIFDLLSSNRRFQLSLLFFLTMSITGVVQ
jgi:4-hydroxybenzoate polyprenyltransferase